MAVPMASNLASVDALSRLTDHTSAIAASIDKMKAEFGERGDHLYNVAFEADFSEYEKLTEKLTAEELISVVAIREMLCFQVLWQVTVSQRHGLKLSGLQQLLDYELIPSTGPVKLVWVTLDRNVADYSKQSIKTEAGADRVAKNPEWYDALKLQQYVYGVPLESGQEMPEDLKDDIRPRHPVAVEAKQRDLLVPTGGP
jgi:hypothetical protein